VAAAALESQDSQSTGGLKINPRLSRADFAEIPLGQVGRTGEIVITISVAVRDSRMPRK
jgi:hypothetical protein